jgi:multicomponent Na+:H+ antiporter subunit B
MHSYLVLRVVAKLLLPFILLYALYVQFHGDFGPGGGFGILRFGYCCGVLLFAGVGVYDLLLGGNYLDYSVMAQNPVHGQHWGIFLVELGVGITVASVMVSVFFTFAGHRNKKD